MNREEYPESSELPPRTHSSHCKGCISQTDFSWNKILIHSFAQPTLAPKQINNNSNSIKYFIYYSLFHIYYIIYLIYFVIFQFL